MIANLSTCPAILRNRYWKPRDRWYFYLSAGSVWVESDILKIDRPRCGAESCCLAALATWLEANGWTRLPGWDGTVEAMYRWTLTPPTPEA